MLKLTTAGESHGPALVGIVTGLPAGLSLDRQAIDADLRRRQQGYGRSPRQRIESDTVEVLAASPRTFAWGEFGIGAAAMLGLVLLMAAGTVMRTGRARRAHA